MRKTYKYRLLGNRNLFERADRWLYLCRTLYNIALEQRISLYRKNKGQISCQEQKKQLTELKKEFVVYYDIGSHTLQDVLERLDKAYSSFFRRAKIGKGKFGIPRFKGKDRYDSFTLKRTGWKLNGKYLILTNLGRFKLRLSRPIEGNIKTIIIRRERIDRWYVCFNCDNVPERKLCYSDRIVGIDVGIKSYIVDSDGHKVDNPQWVKNSEKIIKRRSKKLSRRHNGSNRREAAKLLVSKGYEKIRYQRSDFLHKLANQYIKNYGFIIHEDLNIDGMVINHNLSKSILDCSWGKFFNLLSYKAEEAGRKVICIPMFEPTSKICSNCGKINQDLTLNDRQWVCKSCGVLHDRDYNAAKNIKRVGQTQQALTCGNTQSVACESSYNSIEECQGE